MSFQDYDGLCTECDFHDKCHKNGIDYAKVERCQIDSMFYSESSKRKRKEKPKPIKVILI